MKAYFVLAMVLSAGCATTGTPAVQGASNSGEALDLATELAQLQLPAGTYKQEIAAALKTGLSGAGPATGVGLKGVSEEMLTELVLELLPDHLLVETKAKLYATHYSVDELQGMLQFYRSELGKKSVAVGGAIAAEEGMAILKHFQGELPAALHRMALRVAKENSAAPSVLSWAARSLANDKGATPEELQTAQTAARTALSQEPENSGFTDTLATTEFRLGELDQAVEHESAVYSVRRDDRVVASQLARFEWARLNKAGLKIDGSDVETTAIRLDPGAPAAGSFGPVHFLLTVGQALPKGGNIDALFVSQGRPIGIVRFNLGADHPASKDFEMTISPGSSVLPELKKAGLPADTKLVMTLVNTYNPAKHGVIQWRAKWMDAGVASLP